MTPAVQVRNLVKRYRGADHDAVADVSFDVPDGALFCLLGPNGAGKTSTVSILTTTLRPTSGRVLVAGTDVAGHPGRARRALGVVFQQASLDPNLTAEENLRIHAVLYGLYPWRPLHRLMPPGYRRQVTELAAVLGVGDMLGRRVRALSGGTRRKLEIVRALMHQPRVLFLDEPTTGLDPESRRGLWSYLDEIRHRHNVTVFLTTHYLAEAEAADTICVLAGGRLIESGSPAALKARHLRRQVILDARDRVRLRRELTAAGLPVHGDAGDRAPLRVDLHGHTVPGIARAVGSELTALSVTEPTLEDTYLHLIEESRRADR